MDKPSFSKSTPSIDSTNNLMNLPGIGDIIVEPDEILAKKCGDKCGGLARCSPANSTTCPDVNICDRDRCTRDAEPGGVPGGSCYPRFECGNYTCSGVAISPSTVSMRSNSTVLRQQLSDHFSEYLDSPSDKKLVN